MEVFVAEEPALLEVDEADPGAVGAAEPGRGRADADRRGAEVPQLCEEGIRRADDVRVGRLPGDVRVLYHSRPRVEQRRDRLRVDSHGELELEERE